MLRVQVAINLPVKNIFKQFTYQVPTQLSFLDQGWRVVVPFGGQTVEGFVVRRLEEGEPAGADSLKEVSAALGQEPWFDQEMLTTAQWLAGYYMCSLAEAMRLFVPGKSSIRRLVLRDEAGKQLLQGYQERFKEKLLLAYRISPRGEEVLPEAAELLRRSPAKLAALRFFAAAPQEWFCLARLEEAKISRGLVKQLLEKGWLLEGKQRQLRDSYAGPSPKLAELQLTQEQQEAVATICQAVEEGQGATFLLQGITGSGKTEVYLRCAAQALAQGRQVLVLVPEIALTAQLVARFKGWFGSQVAVAHSKLSQSERADVWYRLRSGQARVLVGVRSAVFAPFANLGLVIIDEEHDSSYKQEDRPCYHAREVAATRCRLTGAPLVLGSATPDLGSYYAARQGRYRHLRLTSRPTGGSLPQVAIVDMRRELAERHYGVLSRLLGRELERVAAVGQQAILLLNRRGYATFVMCRDCGHTISCPHCAVNLVYHSAGQALRCHYCGNTAPIPASCPVCHSRRIKFFGSGTQKAEEELAKLPGVRVLRLDQDSAMAKFAHQKILQQFASGAYNTLIGTQMVAKGHDIAKVTLVGVLSADSSLHLPDFRAGERTFSLLTQAAGRAGRGKEQGRVVLQSYDPANRVLRLAAVQDYDAFAQDELRRRQRYLYPPYVQMLKLTVLDKEEARALALAQKLVLYLQKLHLAGSLQKLPLVAGPFPALVAKVRDLYRYNVLLKAQDLGEVKAALLASEFYSLRNVYFDVDPVSTI